MHCEIVKIFPNVLLIEQNFLIFFLKVSLMIIQLFGQNATTAIIIELSKSEDNPRNISSLVYTNDDYLFTGLSVDYPRI